MEISFNWNVKQNTWDGNFEKWFHSFVANYGVLKLSGSFDLFEGVI